VAFTDRDLEVADQAAAGTTGHGGEAGQAISDAAIGAGGATVDACSRSVYLVPDWVRVRSEDFGLLFYDTRSTRLTFVRSGDRLVPPPFTGSPRVLSVYTDGGGGASPSGAALSRLLEHLVAKGLLDAAAAE
jgi:putative mycofactocin binding protein MftB